jgi:biopolymer transport protein ExbD
MRFSRNSRTRMNSEVKADSLSDIMFFLMLFFLIMSTMIAPQVIKIKLPKADAGKSLSKITVILSVNADNKYFVGTKEVQQQDLESELTKLIKPDHQMTVIIKGDKDSRYQDVMNLVNASNKLKFNISLAVEKTS